MNKFIITNILALLGFNPLLSQTRAQVKSYESYIIAQVNACNNFPCYDFRYNNGNINHQFYNYFDSLNVLLKHLSQDDISETHDALVDTQVNKTILNYITYTKPYEKSLLTKSRGFQFLFRMDNTCVLKDNNDFLLILRMKYQAFEIPMPFLIGYDGQYNILRIFTKFEGILPLPPEVTPFCVPRYQLSYFDNYFSENPIDIRSRF